MKCEICGGDFDKVAECKVCESRFCNDCGDFDLTLCSDCIEFDSASDGELDDLSSD